MNTLEREFFVKTKKVKMTYLGTLEKKVVSDEELKEILKKDVSYEERMKLYRHHWISENFIEENADWLNWSFLVSYQPLSTKLIEKYHLKIDFDTLIEYQKVSQKILLKFREQINVDKLTKYHTLTDKFIARYHDLFCMSWGNICFYQKLSLQFLIDHKHNIDVEELESGNTDCQTVDNFKIFLKMGVI
jgi:hypothetical protein